MKRIQWISMLAAVTALLTGCGAGSAADSPDRPRHLQQVEITLDGHEGIENVGIVMADKEGFFADAGLHVEIFRPGLPYFTLKYVRDGTVDLVVTHQPQVVLAADRRAPVVAFGSLLSHPTAALIWLKTSGIDGIEDLKGKKIGIPGVPFQQELLESLLAQAGLSLRDVKLERVGYQMVGALAGGRADAIFGGSWNMEGTQLESRGLDPVIVRAPELGIPAFDELVVVGRREYVRENPQTIRRFMAAVARGTEAAVEDPEAAVRAVRGAGERDLYLSREALEAEAEATLPLLSTSGRMDPGRAQALVEWMHDHGMVRTEPAAERLFTNAFLEQADG